MLALLLAFTLAHHDDANPYGWHMSCERWLQRSTEIRADPNLDLRSKLNLIRYLKSKVPGECNGVYTWTQVSRGTDRSSSSEDAHD